MHNIINKDQLLFFRYNKKPIRPVHYENKWTIGYYDYYTQRNITMVTEFGFFDDGDSALQFLRNLPNGVIGYTNSTDFNNRVNGITNSK